MTILIVLLWPKEEMPFFRHFVHLAEQIRSLSHGSIFGEVTKEKSEDEDCEYEMIWDAEGSMHLIKQPSKPRQSSEAVPVEQR